jgi:hypothetical protein
MVDGEPILIASERIETGTLRRLLANHHTGRGRETCVELTPLINIRLSQDNASMEISDPEIWDSVCSIAHRPLGEGSRSEMAQHTGLSAKRWRQFTLDQ